MTSIQLYRKSYAIGSYLRHSFVPLCHWIVLLCHWIILLCHSIVLMTFVRTPMSLDRTPMPFDRTPMSFDRTPRPFDRTPMPFDRTPTPFDHSIVTLSAVMRDKSSLDFMFMWRHMTYYYMTHGLEFELKLKMALQEGQHQSPIELITQNFKSILRAF